VHPATAAARSGARAQRVIAQADRRNTNRAPNLVRPEAEAAGYEAVNAEFGITKPRRRIGTWRP
jgi:hypothetical protein